MRGRESERERENWRRRRGEDGYTARLVRDRRGAARKVDRAEGRGMVEKGGGFYSEANGSKEIKEHSLTRSFHGEISSVK